MSFSVIPRMINYGFPETNVLIYQSKSQLRGVSEY